MHHMQRHLARHALGLPALPGDALRRTSYRNRYFTTLHSEFGRHWNDMVGKGWAEMHQLHPRTGMAHFSLTCAGAELALEPGESLCPEDFPPQVDA